MKFKFILTASALSLTIATQAHALTLTCPDIPGKEKCTVNGSSSPEPTLANTCDVDTKTNPDHPTLTVFWNDPDNENGSWSYSGSVRSSGDEKLGVTAFELAGGEYDAGHAYCKYNVKLWSAAAEPIRVSLEWSGKTENCSYAGGKFTCF